jgi:hypothetical protein
MDFGFLYIEETVVIRFRYTANASMRAALPATAVCVCVLMSTTRNAKVSQDDRESTGEGEWLALAFVWEKRNCDSYPP